MEIITWLDDDSRMALHISAHARITATIAHTSFTKTAGQHGYPASTLTDNTHGLHRPARRPRPHRRPDHARGRTPRPRDRAENSRPNHRSTCGKVERFQQTLKNWLPAQPGTIAELQALLDRFAVQYNQQRPHRSLPHRATPAAVYAARPKTAPAAADRTNDNHNRVRTDKVHTSGTVTLRLAGRLHHIGIGQGVPRVTWPALVDALLRHTS